MKCVPDLRDLIATAVPLQKVDQRRIPEGENYVLSNLEPNTVYGIWLAARSQRGEGAATALISIRTKQDSKRITRILYFLPHSFLSFLA